MASDSDSSADEGTRPYAFADSISGDASMHSSGKKKRRKTAASRGPTAMSASRGTGFEEYYADPPMTPAEADEERFDIYALNIPFEQRIQSCIQRFRNRRRLSSQHAHYFNEYLNLGGVDTSPNAFSGIDPRELKTMTPAERRDATAIDGFHMGSDSGRFYNGDESAWSVDFTAIAQGFLSVSVVPLTALEEKPLEMCISLVENFLRYVLQHDVCPEYADDLNSALEVCHKAREEWPLIRKLHALLPGRLNDAAAQLLHFRDADDWAKLTLHEDDEDAESENEGEISAKATLFTAFALLKGEEATFQRMIQTWASGSVETRLVDCPLKLQSIERASEDIHDRFSRLQVNDRRLPAIGKAVFKRTVIKDGWDAPDRSQTEPSIPHLVTLFLDDRILKHMVPGMQMNATLVEVVDVGIYFLKKAGPVLPSFYRFLPQELMKKFKDPKETDRPARSVHDHQEEKSELDTATADGEVCA